MEPAPCINSAATSARSMTSPSGEWPTMETKPQECGWVCRLRLRAPLPRAQAQLEPTQPSKWLSPPSLSKILPRPTSLLEMDPPVRCVSVGRG